MKIKRIQDSVHGLIEFRGYQNLVLDVLHTPEIQRLRNIKQLGLAHLVFPGAEHSRFFHSLGVSHVAMQMGLQIAESSKKLLIPELRPDELEIRDLALAGLCHDLGHGPFSHGWENEIIMRGTKSFDLDSWVKAFNLDSEKKYLKKDIKWHELVSYALLAWEDGPLHMNLERRENGSSQRIRRFLMGDYHLNYLPKILASDIDADRADYIFRDSFMSGAKYGRYDIDWLISSLKIGQTDDGEYVIGYDLNKSVRVVEQFLLARRALYEIVYTHRTVSAAEGMVALFFKRLKEVISEIDTAEFKGSNLDSIIKIIGGEAVSQAELLGLHDYSIWTLIERISTIDTMDKVLKNLAELLTQRNLFKAVNLPSSTISNFFKDYGATAWEKINNAIDRYVGEGNSKYFVYEKTRKIDLITGLGSENKQSYAYFIDSNHKAMRIADHPEFMSFREPKEIHRIYTLKEAVKDLETIING